MGTISSNAFSVDQQSLDVLAYLEHNHPEDYVAVVVDFPEVKTVELTGTSAWFDTDAMGVDLEWGSWLVDRLEQTGRVIWEDGEPWEVEA
jgi:hypothetical protein